MCKRCKIRKTEDKTSKKTQHKTKKKLTCCQKCRRRIRIWLCRRFKRCIKRIIFGDPDPRLGEFEMVGVNLGDVRDALRRKKDSVQTSKIITPDKKPTVTTLFRNANKSTKSIPMKEVLVNEWNAYSLHKSIGKRVKSFVSDFREHNLFLGLSKDSKLNLSSTEKQKYRQLAEKYEKNNRVISQEDLIFLKSLEKLQRRFSLTESKGKVLKNMMEDYKTGKFSLSKIPDKSKLNINTIDKNNLNKLLTHYESKKKKNTSFHHIKKQDKFKDFIEKLESKRKKHVTRNLESIKNMDTNELKRKFSLTRSKQKELKEMMDDYKKGTFSLSKISSKFKIGQKELDKEDLQKILEYYNVFHKKKRNSFIKQSRLKQWKSDLRAKLYVTTLPFTTKARLCACPGNHTEFLTSSFPEKKLGVTSESTPVRHRKRCCPYDFDGKLCRTVGSRILCGYNRNIGSPDTNEENVNLENGCRIRNGRLECGYDHPPYLNSRRPPVWDNPASENQLEQKISKEDELTQELENVKLFYKSTITPKPNTRCIEINDRIVCKTT